MKHLPTFLLLLLLAVLRLSGADSLPSSAASQSQWTQVTGLPSDITDYAITTFGNSIIVASTVPGAPRLWVAEIAVGAPAFVELTFDPAILNSTGGSPRQITSVVVGPSHLASSSSPNQVYVATSAGILRVDTNPSVTNALIPFWTSTQETARFPQRANLDMVWIVGGSGPTSGYYTYKYDFNYGYNSFSWAVRFLPLASAMLRDNQIIDSTTGRLFGWYDAMHDMLSSSISGSTLPPSLLRRDSFSVRVGEWWAFRNPTGASLTASSGDIFGGGTVGEDIILHGDDGAFYFAGNVGTNSSDIVFNRLVFPMPVVNQIAFADGGMVVGIAGPDVFFTRMPIVKTGLPSNNTNIYESFPAGLSRYHDIVISGNVNQRGSGPNSYQFEWGVTPALGQVIPETPVSLTSSMNVEYLEALVSALPSSSTIYYRLKVYSTAGPMYGRTLQGRTAGPVGDVRVTINPPGAVAAGAKWRLSGGAWMNSGDIVKDYPGGQNDRLEFSEVPGYQIPVTTSVTNNPADGTIEISVNYISPAKLLSPASGTALPAGPVAFTWDPGSGNEGFTLWIGSSPGSHDIYPAGSNEILFTTEGLNVSRTVSVLPCDGRPIYVSLYSLLNSQGLASEWQSVYTSYRASKPVRARLSSPANGSSLTSTSLPMAWDNGYGVTSRFMQVGRTPGGYDIYAGDLGSITSGTVMVPAGVGKIHVTLWSLIAGAWQSNSYVFNAQPSERALLTSWPSNGFTFYYGNLDLRWNSGVGVSKVWVYVGTTVGANDVASFIASSPTYRTIAIPHDGLPVYITLWSLINGEWQSKEYWFYSALLVSGDHPASVLTPANTSTLDSTVMPFSFDAGVGVTRRDLYVGSTPGGYDLLYVANDTQTSRTINLPGDGRRVYVTVWSLIGGVWKAASYYFTSVTSPPPLAAQLASPADGSMLTSSSQTFTWSGGASGYYLYVGNAPSGNDLYFANEGTGASRTVSGLPTDGRPIYVTLWSLVGGAWLQNSYWFTTFKNAMSNQRARMTLPAINGGVLPGASATFTWDAGLNVTSWWLSVGSTPKGSDLFSGADTGGTHTRTLTVLPTDGRKIHVTLWSLIGGVWQTNSYLYTAASIASAKAVIISPAAGSTFASASATFNWNTGNGATQYWLSVGTTPGGSNLYSASQGTSLSKAITTLPMDGGPVYVTLWSIIGGVWQSNEYIYTAALPP